MVVKCSVSEFFPMKVVDSVDTDFDNYRDDLIEWIKNYRSQDLDNKVSRSNAGGYQSIDTFYLEESFSPFLDKIWNFICKSIDKYKEGTELGFMIDNGSKFGLSNMWININNPGSYNVVHVHPSSLLSGVIWVDTSENCGNLVIKNPLEMNTCYFTPPDGSSYWFKPINGRMLLFPSCLPHNVELNKSDKDRISISFNLDFVN